MFDFDLIWQNSPLHGHRPDDYACPLCRQQASSVLPIMPSTPAAAMETGKSSTNQECASDVARLLNSSTTPVRTFMRNFDLNNLLFRILKQIVTEEPT